jgi:hypothetical protein
MWNLIGKSEDGSKYIHLGLNTSAVKNLPKKGKIKLKKI